ncbi:Yip1 domain protein [uncultured archaeon]|nr:Yip1 domain protein [uncultured archaeon]
MSFTEKITGTINNPKDTMNRIAGEPHIEEAVMIVGIIAIIGAVAAYVQSYKINIVFENVPSGMDSTLLSGSTATTIAVLSALIGTFIMWLIGTGIIHFISKALGGEGNFYPNLVTAAGYSMIPQIFGVIISLALYLNMNPITVTVDMTNPRGGNTIMNTPFFLEIQIVGVILMLWAATIFVFGVQGVHKLSTGKSAVAVGIPLAFTFLMMLWNLWNIGVI